MVEQSNQVQVQNKLRANAARLRALYINKSSEVHFDPRDSTKRECSHWHDMRQDVHAPTKSRRGPSVVCLEYP